MILKNKIINNIIELEGGYVDDPNDSGGETNYGITEKVAIANGYTGSMQELPKQTAFNIYSKMYWDKVMADDMPECIAAEVVDTGVNMGTKRAIIFLQQALNALNNQGKLYTDLFVDGSIGRKTIEALSAYLKVRDATVLAKALNCLQGAYYIHLGEIREKNETFVYGWLKNRVKL